MKQCPICEKQTDENERYCSKCGHDFEFKYKRDDLHFRANFCDHAPFMVNRSRYSLEKAVIGYHPSSLMGTDKAQQAYNELHGIKEETKESSDTKKALIAFSLLGGIVLIVPLIIIIEISTGKHICRECNRYKQAYEP